MALGIAAATTYAASKLPVAIGTAKIVGKQLLVWTGKKWARRKAATRLTKMVAKKAAKSAAKKGKALTIKGASKAKTTGKNITNKLRENLSISGAERTGKVNEMLRKTYGSGEGFKSKSTLGKLRSLAIPGYMTLDALGKARGMFNPKDTSPLVEKKVKKLDEQEQLEKARVEAQVAATKAQVQQTVPEVGVTPGVVPTAPVATDTEKVPEETTTATPNKKKLSTKKPVKKTFKDVWGKDPSSIQKKLLAGGWTAEELYAKKLAHQQWKKNRGR